MTDLKSKEIEKRFTAALARALSTPHKPQAQAAKKKKGRTKVRPKFGR